jgi:drug/metabolite transporter (DMT)-like permease
MRTHQNILYLYSTIYYYFLGAVLLIGIFYCPFARPISDILKYSGQLFIFFLLFIKQITKHFIDDSDIDWKASLVNSRPKRYFIGIVMTMIMAYVFYAMGVTWGKFYEIISSWTPNFFKAISTLFIIVSGAYVFYELRIKNRSIFGIFEALTGASIIFYKMSISSIRSVESFFTIMTAGFLLIVKGYDDIDQGKIEKQKEKLDSK